MLCGQEEQVVETKQSKKRGSENLAELENLVPTPTGPVSATLNKPISIIRTHIKFEINSTTYQSPKEALDFIDSLWTIGRDRRSDIAIVGHTCDRGEKKHNHKLGLERAEKFKKDLILKGFDESQITADSKGELSPIKKNIDEKSRQINRRVDVTLKSL